MLYSTNFTATPACVAEEEGKGCCRCFWRQESSGTAKQRGEGGHQEEGAGGSTG